jgi:hypothetical protein
MDEGKGQSELGGEDIEGGDEEEGEEIGGAQAGRSAGARRFVADRWDLLATRQTHELSHQAIRGTIRTGCRRRQIIGAWSCRASRSKHGAIRPVPGAGRNRAAAWHTICVILRQDVITSHPKREGPP